MKIGSSARTLMWCTRARGVRLCAFTACSLATRTLAKILISPDKTRDAIAYYEKAADDYLSGAIDLVGKQKVRAILDRQAEKMRAIINDKTADPLAAILPQARECARALDELA